ncbi:two-component system response regulator [Arcobacter acticola]|uniref:Two-component system response regulator n=1 Tax=Arcobacter acticola TaxID=1849015 RepID=A0A6M8EN26_9BACT|nr:response regulator [Arcobacter acticola]QKE28421.1 two-component system response regulator [Arcobacter acticola]
MNNLKDFIKTLNILYVEDEVSAREIFTKILKRFFNTVDARENGLEGYIAFKEKHLKNEKYDLIISDINMPKLDGMEMLEKIREIDSLVPVVFITARHEADVLLKAIELQISDFIIKPIDFDGITKVVNNASEKLFLKNTLLRKNTELELYLKTIEQMAFIIKMDMDLNITYINDIFSNSIDCETSNIIGQNFDFLKSKLSTSNSFDNLKESLLNNNIWEDTIKIEKDENGSIYLKAKIIKIYNDSDKNIQEYVFIAYTVTDQENEKKELNKKMFQNIAHLKKESHSSLIENKKLESELEILKNHIQNLDRQLIDANTSKSSLLKQLEAYEISSLNQSTGKVDLMKKKNDEIELFRKSLQKIKTEKDLLIEKISEFKDTIEHKDNLIDMFKKNETKFNNKIEALEYIITELEENKGKSKKGMFNL